MEYCDDYRAREHTSSAEYIPKWKLAMCVAQVVKAFYQVSDSSVSSWEHIDSFRSKKHAGPIGSDGDMADSWSISRIPFEELLLFRLVRVATGSWQPVLLWKQRGDY